MLAALPSVPGPQIKAGQGCHHLYVLATAVFIMLLEKAKGLERKRVEENGPYLQLL